MNHVFKKTNDKSVIRIILKTLEKLLTIAIILISLIIVVQRFTNNEKSFLGFRMFIVQTGSMIPKYNIGDVILVKEKEIEKIVIGDDLVYLGVSGDIKGKVVTHQVIRTEELEGEKVFYTKGIANTQEDKAPVTAKQINGTVLTKMYIVSFIVKLLSNKYITYFCFILPLVIYIFFTVVSQRLKQIKKEERNTENNDRKNEN